VLALTALYVPGDRPDRFRRAEESGADAVIVDLEDAVAPAHKAAARDNVLAWLSQAHGCRTEVRVNADPRWLSDDLAALAGTPPVGAGGRRGPDVVRLPKVGSVGDVRFVIPRLPAGATLTCLIESARGLEAAYDIARADRVGALALGETDLAGDLGTEGEDALAWARSRVVVAARAAGLAAPMMSVYPHVTDLEGLAESCRIGRRLGMVGRTVVHPRQVPVVVDAFAPTAAEVAAARETLAALSSAGEVDEGALALPDGRMLDPAMAARARTTLALDETVRRHRGRLGRSPEPQP